MNEVFTAFLFNVQYWYTIYLKDNQRFHDVSIYNVLPTFIKKEKQYISLNGQAKKFKRERFVLHVEYKENCP